MFTELYLQTTNPKLTISQFFSANILSRILVSAILHAFIYAATLNVASYVFMGKLLSFVVNMRLFIVLIVIMSCGYFARFFHVKDIYQAYDKDEEATRAHLDKLYIGWIFIA